MGTRFEILPDKGVVYFKHDGYVSADESRRFLRAYREHPLYRAGQNVLVDFAEVADYERDWARVIALQAEVADNIYPIPQELFLVLYAPNRLTQALAQVIANSWDDVPNVVTRIAAREDEALAILGLAETRFSDLLASV